jgi:hypothetical protein
MKEKSHSVRITMVATNQQERKLHGHGDQCSRHVQYDRWIQMQASCLCSSMLQSAPDNNEKQHFKIISNKKLLNKRRIKEQKEKKSSQTLQRQAPE